LDDFRLLTDLHKRSARQGPGGIAETTRAIELARLDHAAPLKIADIGCGTGASSLLLARLLNARVTAVDLLPEFIDILRTEAARAGLSASIDPVVGSMQELPFAREEFDVIWSEGAVYNMGFRNGVTDWQRFLKPGGILAVSEITWSSGRRPVAIEQYWQAAYPEIDTAGARIALLESCGYIPLAYFLVPEYCWLDNYYRPLQASFDGFLRRHGNSADARAIVAAEEEEIALYEEFGQYYSYGFYIAQKPV
jgi:SAM-dependent methyltransferase